MEKKSVQQKEKETIREKKWYAIHTYSGYEDAVARYLKQRIESLDLGEKIFNIIVPRETTIKVKSGKRQTVEDKIYPGYVLVEMMLDNESWYAVRNTPRVIGFVGSDSTTPTPLSEDEIKELMGRMGKKEPVFDFDFKVNETVQIIDGPFNGSEGKIIEVDSEHGKLKILVPIFGRDTSVELDALQVKRN